MPKITHILFDCDNTLVLSEVIAFRGCAQLSNEILRKHNVPKEYSPPELQAAFVGYNFRGLLRALGERHNFELSDAVLDEYVDRELELCTNNLANEAEECVHSTQVLQKLAAEKKYGLAVVSSSAMPRLRASLKKTKQDRYFQTEHVYSAASSLPVPTTKPDPAVYLFACQQLGANPSNCVAVEDSRSGATAAKRAGIPLVGYVGPYDDKAEREHVAKVLREECGAMEIMEDWNQFQEILARIEAA